MHDLSCNTNLYIQIYIYDGYLVAVGESTGESTTAPASTDPASTDPMAMMEFYMNKVAQ